MAESDLIYDFCTVDWEAKELELLGRYQHGDCLEEHVHCFSGRNNATGEPVFIKAAHLNPDRFIGEAVLLRELGLACPSGFAQVIAYSHREMVIELLEGQTLWDRIEEGALDWREALKICDMVLEALDLIHQRGMIHHDLAPQNIWLTPDGGAKVLDMGEMRKPENGHATELFGRRQYRAAETFRQSYLMDYFSLGCILYEMLLAEELIDHNIADYARLQESEYIGQLNDHKFWALPEMAQSIVKKLCSYKRQDRYQTAAEIRADIYRALGIEEVDFAEDVSPEEMGREVEDAVEGIMV